MSAHEMPAQFDIRRLPSAKGIGARLQSRSRTEGMQQPVIREHCEVAVIDFLHVLENPWAQTYLRHREWFDLPRNFFATRNAFHGIYDGVLQIIQGWRDTERRKRRNQPPRQQRCSGSRRSGAQQLPSSNMIALLHRSPHRGITPKALRE